MRCSTGVSGPSVDPEIARFAADVDSLPKRCDPSRQPAAFAESDED